MKFGDSLWARSVQGWRSYNLDYASIKLLIKEHTTPGSGKGVAVPGSAAALQDEFEQQLFEVIRSEHDRVSLFVKSKWYEVRSRLGSIERQINQILRKRGSNIYPKDSLKLRQKYSRIETEILGVGEEIKNLSRFIATNCLAIRKLLKKHAKWTGSQTLASRVQKELLGQTGSLSQYRLEPALNRYTAFLDVIRSPFEGQDLSPEPRRSRVRAASMPGNNDPTRLVPLLQRSAVEFDAALEMSWSSPDAQSACYWVHKDNMVELRVLLLQHMRHAKTASPSVHHALHSADSATAGQIEKEDSVGRVIIDNLERFAESQKEPTISTHPNSPVKPHTAAVSAMWAAGQDASVLMKGVSTSETTVPLTLAIVKKEQLQSAFGSAFPSLSHVRPDSSDGESSQARRGRLSGDLARIANFLSENQDLKPLVRLSCRRTRFVGLENTATSGVWAVLDEDVDMESLLGEPGRSVKAYGSQQKFPHPVLTVRGANAGAQLIQMLDETHLTERVRGFSIGVHAVAACCRPYNMPTPYWFDIMDKDIRHIPDEPRATSSKRSSFSTALSSPTKTTANTSGSGSGSSATQLTTVSESATGEAQTSPKRSPRRESDALLRAVSFRALRDPPAPVQKYWSEYDNPGSVAGDNGDFVIYVDPDAAVFPGQKTLERLGRGIKTLWTRSRTPSDQRDVERGGEGDESTSSDDGSDEQASGESGSASERKRLLTNPLRLGRHARGYGTAARASGPLSAAAAPSAYQPQTVPLALAASLAILAIISILHSSSARRKSRTKGRVDAAVLVGVVASLLFAGVALVSRVAAHWGSSAELERVELGLDDPAAGVGTSARTGGRGSAAAQRIKTLVTAALFAAVCCVCAFLVADGLAVAS